VLGIRPEHTGLKSGTSLFGPQTSFEAVVRVVESAGSEKIVHARVGRHSIVVRLDPHSQLKLGEKVEFAARMETAHIFDKDSGQTIF
jgi:multiple sugar transport system ATP-binding protein